MAARAEAMPFPHRELTIVRLFDAPRALVFKAWTDPTQLARWWGPSGFTNPVCEIDARPGGALRIVMRAPDGTDYPMTGVFREIVAPERLVFSFVAIDEAGNSLLEGLTTVTFAEHGDQTKLTLQTRASAMVARAAAMLDGMEAGWTQSLERLADDLGSVIAMSGTGQSRQADRELTIVRVFDAPRDLVFKAWSEPAHATRWMEPRGFTACHLEQDPRPGGAWRLCLRPDDGGDDLWQGGVFREIVEPERLVFTCAWDDENGHRGHETLITVTFAEHRGKTTMIFRQAVFESVEQRDGHQGGWTSTFDRLEEQLQQMRQGAA